MQNNKNSATVHQTIKPTIFTLLLITLTACSLFDTKESKGCYSVESCLDVNQNDYTITSQGYTTWAEGFHRPSQTQWQLRVVKQRESSFVRGVTFGDEYHWEQRIEGESSDTEIDPYQFSQTIERVCRNGECTTRID